MNSCAGFLVWENVSWEAKTTKLVFIMTQGTLKPSPSVVGNWPSTLFSQCSLRCYLYFTVWFQAISWDFILANRKKSTRDIWTCKVLTSTIELVVICKIRSQQWRMISPFLFRGVGGKVKNKWKTHGHKIKLISQIDFNLYLPLKSEFNICQKYKINNPYESTFYTLAQNLWKRWWVFITTLNLLALELSFTWLELFQIKTVSLISVSYRWTKLSGFLLQ